MNLVIDPARVTRWLSVVVGLLVVASLGGQFSKRVLGHDQLLGLVAFVDLDQEANLPTWYSSMTLLGAALLLMVIARAKWRTWAPYARHWAVLAAIFVGLSIDEAARIHELATLPVRKVLHPGGVLAFAWVIPAGAFVAVVGLAFLSFVRHLPAATRRLFVLAGGLYVGGALGFELVGGWISERWGLAGLAYLAEATLEETAEMMGIVIFIHALLTYIAREIGPVEWRVTTGPARREPSPRPGALPKNPR